MPSDRLFGPSLTTDEMATAVSDTAWLAAMLEFEAGLATAQAAAGMIPREAARLIATACDPAHFDVAAIGRAAVGSASPAVPLVEALAARVPATAAGFVHLGATSQDLLDTAMMLISARGLDLLLAQLDGLADACAVLAERHRKTPMAGRTLLQQASPTTFGLKAAGWLLGVSDAADRLRTIRRSGLAVQLGGGVGTLAAFGEHGLEIMAALAAALGLAEPPLPWHSARGRMAELGAALAIAGGAAAKVALDIVLLAQSEVGEVAEGASGGSSAMPHKRNPVASIEAGAAARLLAGQVDVLVGSLRSEHERAAGAWQAEWPALSEALRLSSGVIARARTAVEGLKVDGSKMDSNLRASDLLMAEAAIIALTSIFGRVRARGLVQAAMERARSGPLGLREELGAEPEVAARVTAQELDRALDPGHYLGAAEVLVDRALAIHRKRRGGS